MEEGSVKEKQILEPRTETGEETCGEKSNEREKLTELIIKWKHHSRIRKMQTKIRNFNKGIIWKIINE